MDDGAYELTVARQKADETIVPIANTFEEDDGSRPTWATKWDPEAAAPKPEVRLKGTAAKWNSKGGYGFIKRDDGLPDVFVHQRNVHRTGYRALAEGEPVEFECTADANGRLEASNVTGPGGVEVLGFVRKVKGDEDSDDEAGAGVGAAKKQQAKPPRPKPYTAFVPRTVKRPAPKPAAKPAAPKPAAAPAAPDAEVPAAGEASAAASAVSAAPSPADAS